MFDLPTGHSGWRLILPAEEKTIGLHSILALRRGCRLTDTPENQDGRQQRRQLLPLFVPNLVDSHHLDHLNLNNNHQN